MIFKFFKFKTKIDLVNTDTICWGGSVAGWQGGRVAGWQGGRVTGWQGPGGHVTGGRGLGIWVDDWEILIGKVL
jgi:hypothetical protein